MLLDVETPTTHQSFTLSLAHWIMCTAIVRNLYVIVRAMHWDFFCYAQNTKVILSLYILNGSHWSLGKVLVFGSGIITIILSSSVSLLWLLLVCVCPLMRSALQLLLPNAEAAVYIAGSVCAAFVANIDGHSDKTVTFNGRMLRFWDRTYMYHQNNILIARKVTFLSSSRLTSNQWPW